MAPALATLNILAMVALLHAMSLADALANPEAIADEFTPMIAVMPNFLFAIFLVFRGVHCLQHFMPHPVSFSVESWGWFF